MENHHLKLHEDAVVVDTHCDTLKCQPRSSLTLRRKDNRLEGETNTNIALGDDGETDTLLAPLPP